MTPFGAWLRSLAPGIIRTLVPVIYALLVRAGALKLGLDEGMLTEAVTAVVTLLVYAGIRFAESVAPKFGWLLGWAKAPSYDPDHAA